MSEFDELVSRDGVLVAGRFGPDWRVAEHKTTGLFIEYAPAFEMMSWFCAAIQMTLGSMGVAMGGFSPVKWTPVNGWAVSLGDFSLAVHGDRFVVAETEKVGSFDELRRLLSERRS
jgi:roadblock/LC7 domain-containing protein